MKSSQIYVLLLVFIILAGSAYLFLILNNQVQQKSTELAGLSIIKAELENTSRSLAADISDCRAQLTHAQQAYKQLLQSKQANFTNPLFKELVSFLEADKTEKTQYNEQTYDCTGFSLDLYKNSRAHGFKSGIVEIEFAETNNAGHMINVFQTHDKGRVFIDVAGTKEGKGEDKVGYIKPGKPYGTLPFASILNTTTAIDCNTTCRVFAKEIDYFDLDVFSYAFFENTKQCITLYNNCSRIFAIDSSERAEYTSEEQNKLFAHLQELYVYLDKKHISYISKNVTVKSIQIYW